ncbi:MAG: signal peptidase I [Desulfobacteraceae bacterium]|nr:signal peptidase I [Desulfobacteraceae bacterium]
MNTIIDESRKISKGIFTRENLEVVVIAVAIALFIRAFVVQAYKIPSGSMKDTLLVGDHLLVNKFIYGVKIPFTDGKTLIPIKDPVQGDIIVFKYPGDPNLGSSDPNIGKDYIKRVIGIEGDTIVIKDKQLYVNGELKEYKEHVKYTDPVIFPGNFNSRDNLGPIKVPEDSLFVMGDNRDNSYDSRFWGVVKLNAVKGEALIIHWSWKQAEFGVRWNRIGNLLI